MVQSCCCVLTRPKGREELSDTSSIFFYFNFLNFYWLIYLCLPWVFVAAHRLSLVVASRGYYPLQCTGFSLWWLLLLGSMDSRCEGSVVVAHGLSCSTAHGIFPDQGLNLCPLHWQAGYYPLWCSFIRALISFRRALPSWLKHLPNTLPLLLSHLELGFQHVNLGKTQTCRPQESTKVESKDVCWSSEEIPPCLSQSSHFLWGEGRNAVSHTSRRQQSHHLSWEGGPQNLSRHNLWGYKLQVWAEEIPSETKDPYIHLHILKTSPSPLRAALITAWGFTNW